MTRLHHVAAARAPLDSLLRSRVVAALASPRSVDDYLALVDPGWSVHEVRARVVAVRPERGGAVTVLLQPNRVWAGFVAGQHVELSVERAGVRHTRCFSIASAPSEGGPLQLSMRALPDGKVCGWALSMMGAGTGAGARAGEVVVLSQAQGDFVLPQALPERVLFISAGSGVTPILSMVRQLAHVSRPPAVSWLHYGRRQTMLEDDVLALGEAHPWLSLQLLRTEGPSAAPASLRHLSAEALATLVPDWAERETFVCGPPAMLAAATDIFGARELMPRLHIESFGQAWPRAPIDHTALHARIVFEKSGRQVRGTGGLSLLEQAEAAGLSPRYGCRMGICHTCKCTKRYGAVRNTRTGIVSDQPNETIRLCVSVPRSDVSLDL